MVPMEPEASTRMARRVECGPVPEAVGVAAGTCGSFEINEQNDFCCV